MDCGVEQSWVTCEKGTKYCSKEIDGSISVQCVTNQWTQECNDDQFLCYNGDCINKSDICNFEENCSDGSDEMDEFCQTYEKYPEDKSKGSCLVKLKKNTKAFDSNNKEIEDHSYIKNRQFINYECSQELKIRNPRDNFCVNCSWRFRFPICEKRCNSIVDHFQLNQRIHRTRIIYCASNVDNPSECIYLTSGTIAIIMCAVGYESKFEKNIRIECTSDGSWDTNTNSINNTLGCEKLCVSPSNLYLKRNRVYNKSIDACVFAIDKRVQIQNFDTIFNFSSIKYYSDNRYYSFDSNHSKYSFVSNAQIFFHSEMSFAFIIMPYIYVNDFDFLCYERENDSTENLLITDENFSLHSLYRDDSGSDFQFTIIPENITLNKPSDELHIHISGTITCMPINNVYNRIGNQLYMFAMFKYCESEKIIVLTKISAHYKLFDQFLTSCYYENMVNKISLDCSVPFLPGFERYVFP